MKRVIHISLFSLFIIMVFGLMGFIYIENAKQLVGEINIRIIRDSDQGFLSQDDILNLIEEADSISSMQIREVSIKDIELRIISNPFVEQADAFINIDKDLVINVKEKSPFLRIFTRHGNGFYLDDQGKPFPLNENYSSLVPIASGYINIEFDQKNGMPVTDEEDDLISALFYLTSVIRQSDFLNAQISQIYLNSKGEYDLIPEVGNHIIQLGSLDNVEDKLDRLELWYKKSFVREGGDKYGIINLRYKDQVVCTRK